MGALPSLLNSADALGEVLSVFLPDHRSTFYLRGVTKKYFSNRNSAKILGKCKMDMGID